MSIVQSGLLASLLSSAVPAAPSLVLTEPYALRDVDEQDLGRLANHTRKLLAAYDPVVTHRVKSGRSAQQKMRRLGQDQILDRLGLRVQVATEADCYAVLDQLRATHEALPGSFDDYIRNPKPNGYQSLHLAVRTVTGRIAEFQVRTFDMHQVAEHGSAAHWRYKAATTA